MTDTKPDLSRIKKLIEGARFPSSLILTLSEARALLDAKEAAEELARKRSHRIIELAQQVDEARASVAAAWDAAAVIIEGVERQDFPDATGVLPPDRFDEGTSAAYEALLDATDPSATEALRRVKEEERNSAFEQAAELMDRYGQQGYADELRGYICNSKPKGAAHD